MIRALAMLGLMATVAAAMVLRPAEPPAFADVSGLWRMRETHSNFEGTLRWTWLEIRQDGDRLEIRAWEDGDTWSCAGKGRVEGRKALFQWWGADKSWRGTASLEQRADELMGIFQRLDVQNAGEQYCRGRRASSSELRASIRSVGASRAFDFSGKAP